MLDCSGVMDVLLASDSDDTGDAVSVGVDVGVTDAVGSVFGLSDEDVCAVADATVVAGLSMTRGT